MTKRLMFVVNTPDFFLSHRLPIAIAARDAGYDVHVATADGEAALDIIELGFKWHILPLSRRGTAILSELRCLTAIYKLMKEIRPDIAHLVTIKPVIYAGIITRLLGIPTVSAISGLGTVYIATGILPKLFRLFIRGFYLIALKRKFIKIIFQNEDDRGVFVSIFGLNKNNTVLIPGSGVNLEEYCYSVPPDGVVQITYAARILKDKGAREFFKATQLLKDKGYDIAFVMAGAIDTGNPSSISVNRLSEWRQSDAVFFPGHISDVKKLFERSHIIVLPSYREGLPKVLIEAAACGRPVVTTNVAGCRDAVINGETGLLVPVRNAEALAKAIEKLILNPDLRTKMGVSARVFAEKKFDIESVVKAHLDIYSELST